MVAVANRIHVNPEYAEQFEDRFRNRAHLVDGMPGFISNKVLRPTKSDQPYVVLTFWESREHFKNWVNSEEFQKGHARSGSLPKGAFTGSSHLEIHEVFLDTEREYADAV